MSALPTPPANPLLCAALAYAAAGIPVFPLKARGKKPLTTHGFKDASKDASKITAWWTKWPQANIGIPTGAASGWAVVDIDAKHGGDVSLEHLLDKNGPIRETPESLTGGGGRHLIFRHVTGFNNSEKALGNGIDTRGEGGYIVAPPSVHESGNTYEWEGGNSPVELVPADLPDWLHPGRATAAPLIDSAGNLADYTVGKGKPTGAPAEVGSRNSTAASLAGQWIQQGDSVHTVLKKLREWNQTNAVPLPDREVQTITASVALTHQRNNPAASIPIGDVEVERPTPSPVKAQARRVPEDLLSPPGLLGELCKWGTETAYAPQPFLALANMLAFFGAVLGHKVQSTQGLRTNMYCLGVGESGCGKDHSRQTVKRICEAAGCMKILGAEDVTGDSAMLEQVADSPTILFQWDEIGHLIAQTTARNSQAHQKSIATLLTKLFTSSQNVLLGKKFSGKDRKDINQPNVCLYGTTAPRRLYGGLSSNEIADGFFGRMLVFQSDTPDPQEQEVKSKEIPQTIIDGIRLWLSFRPPPVAKGNIAQATEISPFAVPMDNDAVAAFKAFRARCKIFKAEARAAQLDPLWARAVEHATKVALIVACGESYGTESIISGTTAAWAIRLVEYLTSELISCVGNQVADNEQERDVLRVLDVIRRAGASGVSQRDLTRRTQWAKPRQRLEILNDLFISGRIAKDTYQAKKGPATLVYTVTD